MRLDPQPGQSIPAGRAEVLPFSDAPFDAELLGRQVRGLPLAATLQLPIEIRQAGHAEPE
ncbi:MAG: hypothetical protein AB1511_09185 [Deinococcota bacterium]